MAKKYPTDQRSSILNVLPNLNMVRRQVWTTLVVDTICLSDLEELVEPRFLSDYGLSSRCYVDQWTIHVISVTWSVDAPKLARKRDRS